MINNLSLQQLRQRWREARQSDGEQPLAKIYLAGSFTIDPLEPYLGAYLLENQYLVSLSIAPHNQLFQLCYEPANFFDLQNPPDVVCLLWRLEDMFPDTLTDVLTNPARIKFLKEEVRGFCEALAHLKKSYSGSIIVSTPPYPQLSMFHIEEIDQHACGSVLHREILTYWSEKVSLLGQVKPLDLHGLLLQHGLSQSHDSRKWYMYRQPYRDAFWAEIAHFASRIILAERCSAHKCIVLDCDNTLWGGIVGEDGISGIQLSEEFPGRAYRDFQKHLVHLHQRGIMLAIASKNNPQDVQDVFDKHDAMVLRKEQISCFEVNWNSKVESLENIARTLNIGVDSLVFIDDSNKEIAEVRQRLPSVTCLLVPEEVTSLPTVLCNTGLFDLDQLTEEDRNRTQMIQEEKNRQRAQAVSSEEDFKKHLQLTVNTYEAQPQHFARISQLVNKTNQFNLSTIRRTQGEIEALAASNTYRIFALDASDKFGDYGLVGAAILECKPSGVWSIDTLLLSCRVLGRDVETAFLAMLSDAISKEGGQEIRGCYIPTQKNCLAQNYFADHGLLHEAKTNEWVARPSQIKRPPQGIICNLSIHPRPRPTSEEQHSR